MMVSPGFRLMEPFTGKYPEPRLIERFPLTCSRVAAWTADPAAVALGAFAITSRGRGGAFLQTRFCRCPVDLFHRCQENSTRVKQVDHPLRKLSGGRLGCVEHEFGCFRGFVWLINAREVW